MPNITHITISPQNMSHTNNGIFQGWGISLCWWANRLGYSDKFSQMSADLFFGRDGLRLNIMRYNIGGGDDPAHKHITRTDSAIPGWLTYKEETHCFSYDYLADHNQLNVLERCAKAAGNDAWVEVFSNSPPYFMTKSGCSSGNENPNNDNLNEDCYTDFAEYLVHVTEYINNTLQIKVKSISPMNEPNTDFWCAFNWKQEGCHFDAGKSQSDILCCVAKALQKHHLNQIELIGSDEFSPAKQYLAYNAYSVKAKNVINRISTHTYSTEGIQELGRLAQKDNFNLWMSEVDGNGVSGENVGEMGSALWLGEKIISDMNALSPSAWVLWQVIDTHICQAGYQGNKDGGMVNVNGGFWGTAVADHEEEKIILTQKYYGFGQFTRYIRPNSTIIHCNDHVISAYHKERQELVIVALNPTGQPQTYEFDLSQFKQAFSSVQVIRTSGSMKNGEHWNLLDDIPMGDLRKFHATLKENSITTFIAKP